MSKEQASRSLLADILKGIGVAIAAGYVFALLFMILSVPGSLVNWRAWTWRPWDISSVFLMPFASLAMFAWFVVPVGALVGAVLPRLVYHRHWLWAVLIAITISLVMGALWAAGFAFTLVLPLRPESSVRWQGVRDVIWWVSPLLALYSLPWVAAFACKRSVRGLA